MTVHTNKICFPVFTNMSVEDALVGVLCCRIAREKGVPFQTQFLGVDTPVYISAERFSALCDLVGGNHDGFLYSDLYDFIEKYADAVPGAEIEIIKRWASGSALSLQTILVYLLFRKMEAHDFFNFLAHRLMTVPKYDITRDPDVIDILNPKEDAGV